MQRMKAGCRYSPTVRARQSRFRAKTHRFASRLRNASEVKKRPRGRLRLWAHSDYAGFIWFTVAVSLAVKLEIADVGRFLTPSIYWWS
jgi:hypothetical protein